MAFWVRCRECQHVQSFDARPDRCPRCESFDLIVLPMCSKQQAKLERREARFAWRGRFLNALGRGRQLC
jgi:hypothetical protein